MSSSEDDHDHDARDSRPPQVKKRRVQTLRACDRCRLKKIRCDGTPSSGQKCSHCAISEATCIFTEGIKKRAPPKKYVDGLESRLERLEALLSRLHPDHDFSHELEDDVGSPPGPMSPESAGPHCAPKRSVSHSSAPSPPQLPSLPHLLDDAHDDLTHSPEAFESDDDEEFNNPSDVSRQFRNADLNASLNRFYGKSSSVRLFRRALTLKSEVSGIHYNLEDEFHNSPFRRPDFWKIHPWERARFVQARSPYTFPEPDLMRHLLANFFHLGGAVCPLFHRPTFEKQVADGLHLVDEGFGGVVSLVCALGSRMSNDPRVFLDDPEKPNHPHSAGWRWFNQVQLVRNLALADPTLHDLQICALAVLFMHGSSPPQACWTLIGIGLRMAQDVGAHRRHAYLDKPLVEMELWKRAFWVLFTLDTWMSSFLGRTCALPLDRQAHIDLEFPIECDDEYWLHPDPEKAFKQPPGKPSKVSYYISWIKLHLIHAHALRTIYSLDKHKIIAQIGRLEWETRVVTELDSALNKWFDSLPDHLRWDPTRENELQFFQTACLHAGYYMVQMTIHRPFIPSSRKESSLSFPSLAICCNSARGCSHVLEVQRQRMPGIATPSLLLPAFMSGIVLLLGIWGAKRSGLVIDSTKQMHDVYNCMRFLGSGEMRWPIAGRLRDLLRNLSAVGELPLPESPPSQKRDREGETENEDVSPTPATTATTSTSATTPTFPPSSGLAPAPRKIAGRRQLSMGESEISTFGPPLTAQDKMLLEAETAAKAFGAHPGPSTSSALSTHRHTLSSSSAASSALAHIGGSSGLGRKLASTPSMYGHGPPGGPGLSPTLQMNHGAQYGMHPPLGMDADMLSGFGGAETFDLGMGAGAGFYGQEAMYNPMDLGGGVGMDGGGLGMGGGPSAGPGPGPDIDVEADELMNFFAGMAPQDGQMGVDSDMMTMWSTLPDGFQTEDWHTYVSNLMGIAGQGGEDDVGQGAHMSPTAHQGGGTMPSHPLPHANGHGHGHANGYAHPHGPAF